MKLSKQQSGFTLIELLLVIAIIAILAAIIFVALDPLTRFQDTRDARRWSEVEEVLHAVKIDQIDNRGAYLAEIAALPSNETWMIGTAVVNGAAASTSCNVGCAAVASTTACVDLTGLATEGYLSATPISPNGAGTWSAELTGYTIERTGQFVKIEACDPENVSSISVQR